MKDKYLIIYENSALLLKKEVTAIDKLGEAINKIENHYGATVLSVSKILVPETFTSICCHQPISKDEFVLNKGLCNHCVVPLQKEE